MIGLAIGRGDIAQCRRYSKYKARYPDHSQLSNIARTNPASRDHTQGLDTLAYTEDLLFLLR